MCSRAGRLIAPGLNHLLGTGNHGFNGVFLFRTSLAKGNGSGEFIPPPMNAGCRSNRTNSFSDKWDTSRFAVSEDHEKFIIRPATGEIIVAYGVGKCFADCTHKQPSRFCSVFSRERLNIRHANEEDGKRKALLCKRRKKDS